jgi:hypothetical protein
MSGSTHRCPICSRYGSPAIPPQATWLCTKACRNAFFRKNGWHVPD